MFCTLKPSAFCPSPCCCRKVALCPPCDGGDRRLGEAAGPSQAGSAELGCIRAAAGDALGLHFGSSQTRARGAVDLACASLESLGSKLSSAFDFPIASSTLLATRPPYLLVLGKKLCFFFSSLLKRCEPSPSQPRLLCGGVRKAAITREEALGSHRGEHQQCPHRWLFRPALYFVAYPAHLPLAAESQVKDESWDGFPRPISSRHDVRFGVDIGTAFASWGCLR